jgi:hypothetical protein
MTQHTRGTKLPSMLLVRASDHCNHRNMLNLTADFERFVMRAATNMSHHEAMACRSQHWELPSPAG